MGNDLRDLADAYVAGMMSDAERSAFESRLENEEEARKALLGAARRDLSLRRALGAVAPAGSGSGTERKLAKRAEPRVWMVPVLTAAAAALVVIAALTVLKPNPLPPPVVAKPDSPERPVPEPIRTPVPEAGKAPESGVTPPGAPPVRTPPLGAPPREVKQSTVASRPVPAPAQTKPATITVPSVAETPTRLAEAAGRVMRVTESGIRPAKRGTPLASGEAIRTGPGMARATIVFPDGTRIDLDAESEARLSEVAGRVVLVRGGLRARVTRQKPGSTVTFETSHGLATVLGTVLRLDVHAMYTRLEVEEGRVRLERPGIGNAVEVGAGGVGLIAKSGPPVSRKEAPQVVTVNFGPPDSPVAAGVLKDSGDQFHLPRGFGWSDPRGTTTTRRGRFHANAGVDALRASLISAGSSAQTETWRMPVANGKYLVSVCVGDPVYEQGPNHVWIEGRQVVNNRITLAGRHLVVPNVPIEVKDGELTMVVGGQRSSKLSKDKTTDTTLNYLIIRRISKAGGK